MSKKKHNLKTLLTDTHHPHYFLVSDFLALTTLVSIVAIVLETMPQLSAFSTWFLVIEWVTVVIFTAEYILRFVAAKKKVHYVFSWFGIIDLVAILPTYFGLGNLSFLKSARVIRLMRLLRMLRIAKMRNLSHQDHDSNLSFYAINILLFLAVIVSATLVCGILIYLVEGHRATFESIPHGMWWSFRIFTGDPSFIRTETIGGEVVYIFTRVVGLVVLGTVIGVIGNVLKKVLFGEK